MLLSLARAGDVELRSPFDPRSLPSYLTLAIGASLTLGFVAFGGFRFSNPLMIVPPLWGAFLLLGGLLARRYGLARIGGGCETIALVYSQSLIMLSSLPMITAFSAPLADNYLVAADHALGFDWHAYAMLFRDSPLALKAISVSYMSFTWEAAAILIALFVFREDDRAWKFVGAAAIALLITVLIYPLAPAEGGFVHYGISHAAYPNLETSTPWTFAPAIHAMKSGNHLITPHLMVGYVSFPSYHAASAVLFTWAAWPLRRARWFFLAVNILMAASAMIVGAHYLMDILGGAMVAVIAFTIAHRRIAFRPSGFRLAPAT